MCSCIHVQYLITSETTFLAPKVLAKISTAWASGVTRCSKCCNIWTTFRLTPRRVVCSSVQCSLLWYMQSVARVVLLHLASYSVKLTDCLQCYMYHQSTASSDFKTAQMCPIGITCITLQCGLPADQLKLDEFNRVVHICKLPRELDACANRDDTGHFSTPTLPGYEAKVYCILL